MSYLREPWIRVHARLIDKPVVGRLCEALRLKAPAAVGYLVTFWGSLSAHGSTNGDLTGITDTQIERWAMWEGKRGAFAQWVRTAHVDEAGRVRDWDTYQGALEQRREKERQRIANRREMLRNGTQDVRATVAQQPQDVATHARERDETRRDETKELQDQLRVRRQAPPPEWASSAAEQWAAKVGPITPRRAGRALAALVTKHGWPAVAKGMADYLTATPGHKAKLEWFAERGAYWVDLASQPLTDPETGQPTIRYRVVVGAA